MKKLLLLAVVLLAVGAFAASAAAEDTTFTGWIADEACAKDYSKAGNEGHKGCATGCLNNGGNVALASPDGLHILDITAEKATRASRHGSHRDRHARRGDEHDQGHFDRRRSVRIGSLRRAAFPIRFPGERRRRRSRRCRLRSARQGPTPPGPIPVMRTGKPPELTNGS